MSEHGQAETVLAAQDDTFIGDENRDRGPEAVQAAETAPGEEDAEAPETGDAGEKPEDGPGPDADPASRDLDSFLARAAEGSGMSEEQLSAVTDALEGFRTAAERQQDLARESWRDSLMDEWPGDEFSKNASLAQRAVRRFGGPELCEVLDRTGLGDHPALVKTFLAVGRALSESDFPLGQPARGPRRTDGGIPMLRFPSMEKAGR